MPINIREVAQFAGVSSATVSRVLSDKTNVRSETRKRVLEAVKTLGYRPSRLARSLRLKRTKIIGLIISDIQNPFFTSLVRAVEDQAYENGYSVFLCNSDENLEKEELYIDLMVSEKVAGVIITPTNEINSPAKKLIDVEIPLVSVDRRMKDLQVDTVVVDNKKATTCLIDHLIEDGHRRIGAIVGEPSMTTGRERLEGFIETLQRHAIPVEDELICSGSPKMEVGYSAAQKLLSLPTPPTAIFAGNNLLSLGCLKAANERGLKIPQDIALVAFDDFEWSSLLQPSLTVAAQPTYEIGLCACSLLLKRIAEPDCPVQEVVFDTEIRIRQSCALHPDTVKGC